MTAILFKVSLRMEPRTIAIYISVYYISRNHAQRSLGHRRLAVEYWYGTDLRRQRAHANRLCPGACCPAGHCTVMVRATKFHLPTVSQLHLLRLASDTVGSLGEPCQKLGPQRGQRSLHNGGACDRDNLSHRKDRTSGSKEQESEIF